MPSVEKSIDVNIPLHKVYNQWTQFEEFPRFMEGIEEVTQVTDTMTHWRAKIGGKEEEWDARILEQTPDRRVAWEGIEGARNAGAVTFREIGPAITRVTLHLDYEPEGVVEHIGDALGFVERRVEGDLRRFKEFIEARGSETGAWRGEIHGGEKQRGA